MLNLPNITAAQWKATVGYAAAIASMFGMNLSDHTQATLTAVLVGLWGVGLVVSDALIRHGRSTGLGVALVNQQLAPTDQPAPDGTPGHE